MVRKEGKRPTETLWIFCEGKTEEMYFKQYRAKERVKLQIKPRISKHRNVNGIVKDALNFKKQNRDFEKGDWIACVFDRNSNTNDQLNKAKRFAESDSILLSFSNPSFEYWILCHYGFFPHHYHDQNEVIDKLQEFEEFSPKYDKTDRELYSKTRGKIRIAIKNAERIKNKHNKADLIKRETNPLTLVVDLISRMETFKDSD